MESAHTFAEVIVSVDISSQAFFSLVAFVENEAHPALLSLKCNHTGFTRSNNTLSLTLKRNFTLSFSSWKYTDYTFVQTGALTHFVVR